MSSRLATSLCGIPLKTPVLAASGTFAYGVELQEVVDLAELGGIITKGLSREPMDGNPAPRLYETEAGMMNSVGLQNIGVRAFVSDKLPALRAIPTPVFANVFGYAVEDYVEVVKVLEDAEGLAGYELNVSCPNTKHGGMVFACDPGLLSEVVSAARAVIKQRPLLVKLSPNVTRIQEVAKAAAEAGADALSLVNTFVALAIDAHTRTAATGQRLRRTLGTGHQTHRAAHGLRSGASGEDSDCRAGRNRHRHRCGRVPDRRSERRRSRHRQFLGPASPAADCPRARPVPGARKSGASGRSHRHATILKRLMKKIISTERAPKAIGPYSQAVISNGWAFLSGQIPLDPATNQIVEGGIGVQTERVIENLKSVLEAAGSSLDRVVKTTVYLKDMGEFAIMNEVYGRYFASNAPARATVEVARLPRDVRVEIDCIAGVD